MWSTLTLCVFIEGSDSAADFVVLRDNRQPNPDAKYLLELEDAIVNYFCSVESSFDVAQLTVVFWYCVHKVESIWQSTQDAGCDFEYNNLCIDSRCTMYLNSWGYNIIQMMEPIVDSFSSLIKVWGTAQPCMHSSPNRLQQKSSYRVNRKGQSQRPESEDDQIRAWNWKRKWIRKYRYREKSITA